MSHGRKRLAPEETEKGGRVNLRKHDGIPSLTNSTVPESGRLTAYYLPGSEDIKNEMLSNLPRKS